MNRRMILYMPLQILKLEALLMLLPMGVSFFYRERSAWSFLYCAIGTLAFAFLGTAILRPAIKTIYAKEGFVIVALSWVLVSAVGALPFVISGEIPSYVDALFETVSGFTTTGASILRDVESMSRGLLFWRSFTHWLGGMGILTFFLAVGNMADGPIHIMRAEMPGPIVGKFVPRAKDTAKILYIIYIVFTVAEILLLLAGGMPLFEASTHAMGTAGTGGFGVLNTSIASYSPYLQWVITVFMLLFGVNFNIYFLLLIRKFRAAAASSEMWAYLGIFAGATIILCIDLKSVHPSFSELLRTSAFQVSSIMTTTGYATADFAKWPEMSKAVLLFLMVVGACAGSTGGGLKVSRLLILAKAVYREFKKLLHPRSVTVLRLEGKALDESVVSNTLIYFVIYSVLTGVIFLVVCLDRFNLETAISSTIACFNNIGPAFNAAGPTKNYADFSVLSKLTLSAAMLLGRLEIFPLLLAVFPVTWIKK